MYFLGTARPLGISADAVEQSVDTPNASELAHHRPDLMSSADDKSGR
jgi:hypothetical protein